MGDDFSEGPMKTMITRLVSLEEELQREKRKMADKQKVIEAQVQTIQVSIPLSLDFQDFNVYILSFFPYNVSIGLLKPHLQP